MKKLIILFTILSIASILTGYFWVSAYSQKMIGFGVVGLFFIVFPLFIYHRWKGKNVKDYMITKESIEKMRNNEKNI